MQNKGYIQVLLLIIGLLLFTGLVVVHEFGHFIFARRNGVEVEEFAIGFPPRLYKRRMKGGWLFSINLLPLGGFVKMKGEHDNDTEPGTFGAASLAAKTKIMAAGVGMNLLTALVLFTGLSLVGIPSVVCNQYTVKSDTKVVSDNRKETISYVEPGSPAAKVGIKAGDQLLAYGANQNSLQTAYPACSLGDETAKLAGQPMVLKFKHGGQTYTKTAQLLTKSEVAATQNSDHPKGYLGVVADGGGFAVERSTWSAPIKAVGLSVQFTEITFKGLGTALAGFGKMLAGLATANKVARQHGQTAASSQVSGPLGIFFILKDGSALGLEFILFIIAIISLTLAIMNFLPIPALDGGRLWLTLGYRAFGRTLTQEREEFVNAAGFVTLIVLMILITIVDVKRFF